MTHCSMPLFAIVAAAATLWTATARAQAAKTEPKAEDVRVEALPKQAVEAMRREVDAIQKKKDVVNAINRAIPVIANEQVLVQNVRVNEAMFQQLAQQFVPQVRPILRVEYQFLRTVCNPSKEQRIPIARAGLDSLDEAVKKYAEWQVNRGRVVAANGQVVAQGAAVPDPRKLIQDALAAAAKEHLSPEQSERYREELEARSEEQKRVGVLYLVAKLDLSLVLSPEQREKISASLASRWDDSWSSGLYSSIDRYSQYMPMISESVIVPFLDDAQKEAWAGIQKVSFASVINMGVENMDADPLDDEFPDELAQQGPKPGAKQ